MSYLDRKCVNMFNAYSCGMTLIQHIRCSKLKHQLFSFKVFSFFFTLKFMHQYLLSSLLPVFSKVHKSLKIFYTIILLFQEASTDGHSYILHVSSCNFVTKLTQSCKPASGGEGKHHESKGPFPNPHKLHLT